MAIAYVGRAGSNHGTTAISSFTITTSSNISAGNLILVSVVGVNPNDSNDLTSVTDSASNSYVSAGFFVDAGLNCLTSLWYCKNCSALSSSQTVTVNFHTALQSSGPGWGGAVDNISGADTSAPVDQHSFIDSGTAATWATTTITTVNANDLVFVLYGTNGGETAAITQANSSPTSGWTIQSGITISTGIAALRTSYQIFSATGSYKGGGTQSTSLTSPTGIVAWKAAGGGAATPKSTTLALMGVG